MRVDQTSDTSPACERSKKKDEEKKFIAQKEFEMSSKSRKCHTLDSDKSGKVKRAPLTL